MGSGHEIKAHAAPGRGCKRTGEATRRGTGGSVSRLVEDYFQLLLQEPTEGDGRSSEDPGFPETPSEPSGSEEALSLQIRALKENLGKPATVELPRLAGWGIALTVPPVL